MLVGARVRSWDDEQGWGALDSTETLGGCWTHYSVIAQDGYRTLTPGQDVQLEREHPGQDGWPYRAVRAWPADAEPVDVPDAPPGMAYDSELRMERAVSSFS